MADMTRQGRWGLSQLIDDEWQSTGSLGYHHQADAEANVERLNSIQPERWRLRDRRAVR